MKKLINIFALVTLVFLVVNQGCKDSVSADTVVPTLILDTPHSNDTVMYGKTPISYSVTDEQGITNINVFINNEWVSTYQPKDRVQPEVFLVVDSAKYVGKIISYHLTAVDYSGNVAISEKRTGIYVSGTLSAPQAPSGVQLSELTKTTFQIQWAEYYQFTDVLELWRKAGTSGTWAKVKNVIPDSLKAIDTVASASSIPRYFYKLRAVNHYGGSFSAETSITDAPPAPTNVGLIDLSKTIFNIHWSKISSKATGLELWRKAWDDGSYEFVKSVPVDFNNVNDTVPDGSVKYYYKLRATNNFGPSAFSTEVESPATIPAPYSIVLTLLQNGHVQVSWSYGNVLIHYFRVERGVSSSSFDKMANLLPDVRTWEDTSVSWTASTKYYYRVIAVKGRDEAISDVKSISNGGGIGSIPAPINFSVTAAGSQQINLRWTNTAPNGSAVLIERKKQGDASYTDLGANILVSTSDGFYADQTVKSPNTYLYRIRYRNGNNYSNYLNAPSVSLAANTNLSSPLDVAAISLGRHKVKVTWKTASGNVAGYRIQRGISTFQFNTIGNSLATEFIDSSDQLQPNITRLYRVQAFSLTDSASSEPQTVVLLDFDAPSELSVSTIAPKGQKLSWKNNMQYFISTLQTVVERKNLSSGQQSFVEIGRVSAAANEFIDSGVAGSQSLVYRLKAVDGSRYSDYSAELAVNTVLLSKKTGTLSNASLYTSATDGAHSPESRVFGGEVYAGLLLSQGKN